MDVKMLESIRNAEGASHTEIYSTAKLFEKGSWLQRPVKTIMDLLSLFSNYNELNVLDLGCGVGRNCIPVAEKFKNIYCRIDCVDILEFAIEKLKNYSMQYGIFNSINGIVSSIEDYQIENETYDLIIAVSALEHVASVNLFEKKLLEIDNGLKNNGIACLIVNSDIVEINKENEEQLMPQFEINLETNELLGILKKVFSDYKILKETVVEQHYDVPRGNCISTLSTKVVTYVVQK